MNKVNILNLQINHISKEDALEDVLFLAKNRTSSYICFANAHMTIESNEDSSMRNVVNSADYTLADGAPVAKAFKILHGLTQNRIPGMNFFPEMLDICHKNNLKITLLGSTVDVLNKIESRITVDFPELEITNKISPPFNVKWNNEQYINAINTTKTNVVFVALGCPIQEKWMHKHHKKIDAVLLGVGGAFPVYAKVLKRAPKWMSNNGLEWFFRLMTEPKRLYKRYFYTNTRFLKLLLFTKIRNGRF